MSEYILEVTALSQEEIDSFKASANPTFNIDVKNDSIFDAKESEENDNQRKEKDRPSECLTLLDVIEDDMFNEKSTNNIKNHLTSHSHQEPHQREELIPYANVPDSELSATELRKKHGLMNSNTVISNITESLLIKNFYTIKSPSSSNDQKSVHDATTNQSVEHKRLSTSKEAKISHERWLI